MGPEHTLVIHPTNSGFFSNFNRVVNHLRHSLGRDGCRAVRVDWHVDRDNPRMFAYGTADDGNTWEHFFEPLQFPDAPARELVTTDYADLGMTGPRAYRMYKAHDSWRADYHRAFREHIRVTARITRRVEQIWADHMQEGFCLGVHYRHPHHDREAPRPAPAPATQVQWVQRLLPPDGSGRVLLATDVTEAVDVFRDAFGERLLVADATRANLNDPAGVHHAPLNPGLALGEEVLIDALLLARCDLLLHGTSNVATAVGYMNPGVRMIYCEPVIAGLAATARARALARLRGRFPAIAEAEARGGKFARRLMGGVGMLAQTGWLAAQRARARR